MKTFEEYLEEICFQINPTVLDDNMSDFFDNWLGELDGEDYIKWGELYGKEMFILGELQSSKKALEIISNHN